MNANYDDLSKIARNQGWDVSRTAKNQWRFVPPDKTKEIVIAAGTPSDVNARRQFIRRLKKSGLVL